jgi:hypothetical protein
VDGQSLVGRLVFLPVERGDVLRPAATGGNPAFDDAQAAAAGLYAEAMAAYVKWLCANWDAAQKQFIKDVDESAARARAVLPNGFDRLPDYYGILNGAQRLALRCFEDMGQLSPEMCRDYAEQNAAAILEIITRQAGRVAEQSPAQMFLQALESLFERRKCHLMPRSRAEKDWFPPDRSEQVGWFDPKDNGAIWLSTNDALSWAKNYWSHLDVNFDVTRDSLKRLMLQSDVLRATAADGDAEVSKWMVGGTKRALEIDVEKVRVMWGIDVRFPRPLYTEEKHEQPTEQ